MFADQAAKDLSALDPGGDIDDVTGLTLWRLLPRALVGTVPVIVPDLRPDHPRAVPGEDAVECRGELTVPVTDQEPEPAGALTM